MYFHGIGSMGNIQAEVEGCASTAIEPEHAYLRLLQWLIGGLLTYERANFLYLTPQDEAQEIDAVHPYHVHSPTAIALS